jgi:type VI secretion system secreted protein VgrG
MTGNIDSLNQEYLLTEVSHAGTQPQTLEEYGDGSSSYSNSFSVIPADVQYRPVRQTPRPLVTGVQTALVVGPQGEEIYTDEYGRVKVQFHWDRVGQKNDKSSCWLRVAQTWGGGNWGSQFIPRIGDEVLVSFIEGNPDRPLVTGSVYNGDNIPINPLTKSITQSGFRSKTHKGQGFNELRFDDANGAEEVYLQGQKDWNILIKNDKGQTVGHDETLSVGQDRTKSVGRNQSATIGGNNDKTVKGNQTGNITGNNTQTVDGNNYKTVKGDYIKNIKGNKTQNIEGNHDKTIKGHNTKNIAGNSNETIEGGETVRVGKTSHKIVEEHATLNCGATNATFDKSGTIALNGKDISITGNMAIKIKGSLVDIN